MSSVKFGDLVHSQDNNYRVAKAWQSLGCRIVPWWMTDNGRKRPALRGWQSDGALSTAQEVEDWWAEHPHHFPGIATGESSGVWMLDNDPRHGGNESLEQLWDEYGPFPQHTPTNKTPSGGDHYWFLQPEGGLIVPSRVGVLPGIDVRGARGFAGAPGTMTPRGNYGTPGETFRWPPPPAPQWLLDIVCKPSPGQERDYISPKVSIEAQMAEVSQVRPGHQELALFDFLARLHQQGVSPESARSAGWWIASRFDLGNAGEPWTEEDVRDKVASIWSRTEYAPPELPPELVAYAREQVDREGSTLDLPADVVGELNAAWSTDSDRFFGKTGLLHASLREEVQARGPIVVGPGKSLWYYQDGVWLANGEDEVRRRCRTLLGQRWRTAHVEGVIKDLSAEHQLISDEQPLEYINCRNGLLDWHSGELLEHSPEAMSTYQLSVDWNPEATCPFVDAWIDEVMDADVHPLLWEVFGTAVYPSQPFHRAVMLTGPARNGKGTFLRLVGKVVGRRNYSSITLHQLTENRFSVAELFGKVANISGDIDSRVLGQTDMFKMMTGEDEATAERKHGQPFQFHNRATMLFSANELPGTSDLTDGFFERWLIVPFTKASFVGREDSSVEQRLHLELEGALVRAVAGLRRAIGRKGYHVPAAVAEATAAYRSNADPVRRFLDDVMTVTGSLGDVVERNKVYSTYRRWCEQNGHRPMATQRLYKHMKAIDGRIDTEYKYGGVRMLRGVLMDENAVPWFA